MEIRNDMQIGKSPIARGNTGTAFNVRSAPVKDGFVKSSPLDLSLSRPALVKSREAAKPEEPMEPVQSKETDSGFASVVSPYLSVSAANAAVPGPVGAGLQGINVNTLQERLTRLEEDGAMFFKARGWSIPISCPHINRSKQKKRPGAWLSNPARTSRSFS